MAFIPYPFVLAGFTQKTTRLAPRFVNLTNRESLFDTFEYIYIYSKQFTFTGKYA